MKEDCSLILNVNKPDYFPNNQEVPIQLWYNAGWQSLCSVIQFNQSERVESIWNPDFTTICLKTILSSKALHSSRKS